MKFLTIGQHCIDSMSESIGQMSQTDLITLVLTSSVLSAGLTAFVNWLLQKKNYRNEYYKKLLDKRIDAYEEVEDLVSRLTAMVNIGDGKMCNLICHLGYDHFSKFLISIMIPIKKGFWLSDNISGLLTELNVFLLNEIDNKIDEKGDPDKQLIELGIQNIEKIRSFRKNIQSQLYNDLRDLHNIRKFVKGLRQDETYAVYGKSGNLKSQV
jgi:hypothetical protein